MTNLDLERLQRRLRAARGEIEVDLVIGGGLLGNVYTGEWLRQDIALYDGVIVGVGDYPGPRVEVPGCYVLPGFIDGHSHLESSMLTPLEFSYEAVKWGTTSVFVDPHEIANVLGRKGVELFLEQAEIAPLTMNGMT